MPDIGVPSSVEAKNQFKNIKLKSGARSPGDVLNKLSGNKEGVGFVDAKKHNVLGKNEFLKLMTYQMQNQDPLNPMDQKKMTGEMAQFAALEQMTNMNSALQKMQQKGPTEDKFFAASFLGKKIVTRGSSVNLREVGNADLSYSLKGSADKILIRVLDEKGQMVQQLEPGPQSKGSQVVTWDGTSGDGYRAGSGIYAIQVLAWDRNGQQVEAETKTMGRVTGVNFENGETVFTVDGKDKVFLRDVDSFYLDSKQQQDVSKLKENVPRLSEQAVPQLKKAMNQQVQQAYQQNGDKLK